MRIALTTIFLLSLVLGALPQPTTVASDALSHDCPCAMPSGQACGGCCPGDTAPAGGSVPTDDCAAGAGMALCDCGLRPDAPEIMAVLMPVHDPTRTVVEAPIPAFVVPTITITPLRAWHSGADGPPTVSAPERAALGVWRA